MDNMEKILNTDSDFEFLSNSFCCFDKKKGKEKTVKLVCLHSSNDRKLIYYSSCVKQTYTRYIQFNK